MTPKSLEAAFAALSDPESQDWGTAFAELAGDPETAPVVLEAFAETLLQLGVEPSGIDHATGQPTFNLRDIAGAMGIPPHPLEDAVEAAGDPASLHFRGTTRTDE